jgi:hypothetical protein
MKKEVKDFGDPAKHHRVIKKFSQSYRLKEVEEASTALFKIYKQEKLLKELFEKENLKL